MKREIRNLVMLLAVFALSGCTKKMTSENAIKKLMYAVKMYESAYSVMPTQIPLESDKIEDEQEVPLTDAQYDVMIGNLSGHNLKGIRFLRLVPKGAKELFDPWGRRYQIIMDANYNGTLGNVKQRGEFNHWIAVWSVGEDLNDESDDINSWELP